MKTTLKAIVLAISVATSSLAHAQIPVTDVANLAQNIQSVTHAVTQITNQLNQLTELQKQVTQLTNTYSALTGNRGLGTVANTATDQAMRRYLPTSSTNLEGLTGSASVSGYGSLQSQIAAAKSAISSLPAGFFPGGSAAQASLDKWLGELAKQQTVGAAAYDNANSRIPVVENLISTIGVATDPKAVAEIQARIQAEQVIAQNESNKMQALIYKQRNEEMQREQRSLELLSKQGRGPSAVVYP